MARQTALPALLLATFTAGVAVGRTSKPAAPAVAPAAASRVLELRTYTSPAGKLPELHTLFRAHTMRLF